MLKSAVSSLLQIQHGTHAAVALSLHPTHFHTCMYAHMYDNTFEMGANLADVCTRMSCNTAAVPKLIIKVLYMAR